MTTTARFIVLWGTPSDPPDFDRHRREIHVPLTKRLPGLRRYTLSRGTTAIRCGDPYHLIAELDFDDLTALQDAFGSPEGQAAAADVAHLAAGASLRSMVYELEEFL